MHLRKSFSLGKAWYEFMKSQRRVHENASNTHYIIVGIYPISRGFNGSGNVAPALLL